MSAIGHKIDIQLRKVDGRIWWPRLTAQPQKPNWIQVYNVTFEREICSKKKRSFELTRAANGQCDCNNRKSSFSGEHAEMSSVNALDNNNTQLQLYDSNRKQSMDQSPLLYVSCQFIELTFYQLVCHQK